MNGYDDIDTSLMGYLSLDIELQFDEIEDIFKIIYEKQYDYDLTKKQFNNSINHKKPKKGGSFVDKIKIEKLANIEEIIKKISSVRKHELIYASEKNVINELNKRYRIINIKFDLDELNNVESINPYDTYLIFNCEKSIIPIFKETGFSIVNPVFEHIITNDFLKDFNEYNVHEGKFKQYKFKKFWNLLASLIFHNDKRLKIQDVITSNLSVLKDNTFYLSTNIDNGVVITKDNYNLIYTDIEKDIKQYPEIDEELNKLYPNTAKLIKTQIISSIINENPMKKHIFALIGSAELGKSSTAQLISCIVCNNYSTITITDLNKIWGKFFVTRIPILDNIDVKRSLSTEIASDLSQIITSKKFITNERYTKSGKIYTSNVYPIITTIHDDLFEYHTALNTRVIKCKLNYNKYAKKHLDRVLEDNDFMNKAKLHFYFLTLEYLKNKEMIKLPFNTPRSTNFFKVLFWLDEKYAKKTIKYMHEYKDYSETVIEFLEMLDINSNLQNNYIKAGKWTNHFKTYLEDKYNKEYELIKGINNKLISSYIKKYVANGRIGKYYLKDKRINNGKVYKFEAIKHRKRRKKIVCSNLKISEIKLYLQVYKLISNIEYKQEDFSSLLYDNIMNDTTNDDIIVSKSMIVDDTDVDDRINNSIEKLKNGKLEDIKIDIFDLLSFKNSYRKDKYVDEFDKKIIDKKIIKYLAKILNITYEQKYNLKNYSGYDVKKINYINNMLIEKDCKDQVDNFIKNTLIPLIEEPNENRKTERLTDKYLMKIYMNNIEVDYTYGKVNRPSFKLDENNKNSESNLIFFEYINKILKDDYNIDFDGNKCEYKKDNKPIEIKI